MNINNLKLFGLNIKDYLLDIVLLLIWGLPTNIVIQWLYFSYFHKWWPWLDISPLTLDVIKIIIWVVSYLVLKSFWKWSKTQYSLIVPSKYSFNTSSGDRLNTKKFIKDWSYQGNVLVDNNSMLISNSNSGCLIKPVPRFLGISRIWKNFVAEIEFSFPKQQEPFTNYFGIIFRARNFEDYLMAEFVSDNNFLIFRPHIRFGGDWDAPMLNIDKNRFQSSGSIIKLKIEAVNEVVLIYINNNYAFEWIVPSHVEPWLKQHAKKDGDEVIKTIIPELYFRNQAGMFGFRCYGNQRVLITSLKLEGINNFNLISFFKDKLSIFDRLNRL